MRKISEEGVRFASPVNGDKLFLTPEVSMQIQTVLNSDIVMQFDECTPYETKGHLTTEREARVDGAEPALGASAARPSSRAWATRTRCSASCRAACSRTCARSRWTRWSRWTCPATRWAASAWASPRTRCCASWRTRRTAAGAQAALPDGRGHAGRPGRRRGLRRGHVRLRDAHAQRAQRPPVHPLRRPAIRNARHKTDEQPLDETCTCGLRRAAAAPADGGAAASAAPTCTTWTAAARCWARCWPASTTCTTT
jgi:queuine tRNA-ribosyltransferase